MRAIALALLGLALAAPTAGASPPPPDDYLVVAQDPPPPPPDPPDPRHSTVALATGGVSFASDADTRFERFGSAAGLGIAHLSHCDCPGFEVLAGATGGERGSSYSLVSRMVFGPRLRRKTAMTPFVAIGVGFAISRLDDEMERSGAKGEAAGGLGIGPSAALGVHGFLSRRLYWRAGAGFVGAGIGTFSTDLSLGWVLAK